MAVSGVMLGSLMQSKFTVLLIGLLLALIIPTSAEEDTRA